eukprot:CAMPEP_0194592516 /NCGR_PEP_ID=MMETSP0292-20121207/22834_1 /TAXON_ID=39354 /ORGANISM="Heterosigma akashiwo, Strain CCMP2393" /LENGTH=40 /DNA_ID= /DNA_START= /DNA_END= /DNA_ORIENTATION=
MQLNLVPMMNMFLGNGSFAVSHPAPRTMAEEESNQELQQG